jgi:hypothetical protein
LTHLINVTAYHSDSHCSIGIQAASCIAATDRETFWVLSNKGRLELTLYHVIIAYIIEVTHYHSHFPHTVGTQEASCIGQTDKEPFWGPSNTCRHELSCYKSILTHLINITAYHSDSHHSIGIQEASCIADADRETFWVPSNTGRLELTLYHVIITYIIDVTHYHSHFHHSVSTQGASCIGQTDKEPFWGQATHADMN